MSKIHLLLSDNGFDLGEPGGGGILAGSALHKDFDETFLSSHV